MNLDLEIKEIDALGKLHRFLDQFDCWWISDISYDFGNDSNITFDSCEEIKFHNNIEDLLEDK